MSALIEIYSEIKKVTTNSILKQCSYLETNWKLLSDPGNSQPISLWEDKNSVIG